MRSYVYYTYTILYLSVQTVNTNAANVDENALGSVESSKFDTHCIYKVILTQVPLSAIRHDFTIETVGLNFLQINVKNANIAWKVLLIRDLPLDKIVYPDYSIERVSKNSEYSEWQATILMPSVFNHSLYKSLALDNTTGPQTSMNLNSRDNL